MLKLENVQAGYGAGQVLFGVNLEVMAGSCISLMGRNGMGKTTTIRTIMGQLALQAGRIYRFGNSNVPHDVHEIARSGIGLVPEGRQIFSNLSVEENLLTFYRPPVGEGVAEWTYERVLDLFPRLRDRVKNPGNHLSGGEQQMLAIGRALMTNPRLLILDEATEGLAPIIRAQIWECLASLKAAGQSILIVDKNIAALNQLADKHFILEKGRIVWHGDSKALSVDEAVKSRYLGL